MSTPAEVGHPAPAWTDISLQRPRLDHLRPGDYAVAQGATCQYQPCADRCPLCTAPLHHLVFAAPAVCGRLAIEQPERATPERRQFLLSALPAGMRLLRCEACDVRFASPETQEGRHA